MKIKACYDVPGSFLHAWRGLYYDKLCFLYQPGIQSCKTLHVNRFDEIMQFTADAGTMCLSAG